MTNGKGSKFAMYELYLGTAEKVSDRRVAWAALLKSYREINRAKFAVLSELEADLPRITDH